MTNCQNCGKQYVSGNWKWSLWLCAACVKAGVKPK